LPKISPQEENFAAVNSAILMDLTSDLARNIADRAVRCREKINFSIKFITANLSIGKALTHITLRELKCLNSRTNRGGNKFRPLASRRDESGRAVRYGFAKRAAVAKWPDVWARSHRFVSFVFIPLLGIMDTRGGVGKGNGGVLAFQ
jgi:hypothetical protein